MEAIYSILPAKICAAAFDRAGERPQTTGWRSVWLLVVVLIPLLTLRGDRSLSLPLSSSPCSYRPRPPPRWDLALRRSCSDPDRWPPPAHGLRRRRRHRRGRQARRHGVLRGRDGGRIASAAPVPHRSRSGLLGFVGPIAIPSSFDRFMFSCRLALVPSRTFAFVATAVTMWQMRMREIESVESGPFPERPREPDCTYYLRTGLCRFGITCRYNHPPNRQMVNLTHLAASCPP